MKIDDPKLSSPEGVALTHTAVPNGIITSDTTISQLLAMLKSNGISLSTPCINLNLVSWKRLRGDCCTRSKYFDLSLSIGKPSFVAI